MFKLLNMSNKNPLAYEISYGGKSLVFTIGKLINKRDKNELHDIDQTILINSYLNYKGDAFKAALMDLYIKADETIMESIANSNIYPLPFKMVHDILDMFDLMDIFHYIKFEYKVSSPSNLKEEFDISVEAAGLGTRVQTYTINDYFELAATTIPMKAVLGPIGAYYTIHINEINGNHKETILYDMVEGTHVDKSPAFGKVKGSGQKIIDVTMRDKAVGAVTVIDKQMALSELPNYILATVALQKIAISNVVRDNKDENIITKIYHYTNNKLRVKGDASNRISDKKPMSGDGDSSSVTSESQESIVESYRVSSDLALGFEVELDWAMSNINNLIPQFKVEMKPNDINTGLTAAIRVVDGNVSDEQIQLLTPIFKHIIDPRGIEYLSRNSLINMVGVGYSYLMSIGFNDLANILTSTSIVDNGDTLTINTSVNKARVPQELKDKLDVIYPYKRVINKLKTINLAEERINILANNIFSKKWYCNITNSVIVVPSDMKVRLTEFIIKNEELCYA